MVGQQRGQFEHAGRGAEIVDPGQPELVRLLAGEGFFVAGQEEGGGRHAGCGFDLDQPAAAVRLEGEDIAARRVAVRKLTARPICCKQPSSR